MMGDALIAARFVLMIDLALLMGLPLFWWLMGMQVRRRLVILLALGGLATSGVWLLASAAAMTGMPLMPPDWATAQILLTMTPIGTVLMVRAVALLLTLLIAALPRGNHWAILPAAIAAATLAWTGHAGATEDIAGSLHRAVDVAHIWAASAWLGALAVLLHAVVMLPATSSNVQRIARMLSQFAIIGTVIVATLIVSGIVNGIMIVGVTNLPALTGSSYGWLLAAKLALFALMLGLAAANRWRLSPALEHGPPARPLAHLRLSLLLETSAAIAIIGLVAALGTLDPMA